MDLNKLVARAKAMLLSPKSEWPVAATEPTTVADLYKGYIIPLAAIPAIFGFLKMSIIGTSVMFAGTYRASIGVGLTYMVVSYVISLIMLYVVALVVDEMPLHVGVHLKKGTTNGVIEVWAASGSGKVAFGAPFLGQATASVTFPVTEVVIGVPDGNAEVFLDDIRVDSASIKRASVTPFLSTSVASSPKQSSSPIMPGDACENSQFFSSGECGA